MAAQVLVGAVNEFAPLVAFLGPYAQDSERARIKALQADRLASFFAIAIGARVQCRVI
jgi:hypothetical protein